MRFDELQDYLRERRPARVFVLDYVETTKLSQQLRAGEMPPLVNGATVVKVDLSNTLATCLILFMLFGFGCACVEFWNRDNSQEHWTSLVGAAIVFVVLIVFFGYFFALSLYACLYFIFEPERIRVHRQFVTRGRSHSFALASITGISKRKGYGPKGTVMHTLEIECDGTKTEIFMDPDTSPTGRIAWCAGLLEAATGFRVTDHTATDRTRR